ncbi:MAG: hypothetical protein XD93_1165 [candidate division WS6 bacterium 34_10]|uniref:Uncharacterized protein n=1 Tax=candidate division WS6 bacterium 34_10 TaxID=1641389 RepID=A0A124FWU8_9BACT|nr:MAG: hypothetical protein XD93_1165 [candidate division WS6 bacterium 34_10]
MFSKVLIRVSKLLGLNYFFNFIKRYSGVLYSILLIGINLIPIYGVFYLDWNVYDIIFLYWIENIVIGIFNVVMMACAQREARYSIERPALKYSSYNFYGVKEKDLTKFFIGLYTVFLIVHGVFLITVFGKLPSIIIKKDFNGLITYLVSLLSVYLFSLIFDYFGKKQNTVTSKASLMWKPFLRVLVIHMVILLGYGFVGNRKLISIFIVVKIIADLILYWKNLPSRNLQEITINDKEII